MRSMKTSDSPALRELARIKRFPGSQELTLATGFKMTQEEYSEFKDILRDSGVMERLDRLVTSEGYAALSRKQKTDMIDQELRRSRDIAKALIVRDNPKLRDELLKFQIEKLIRETTPEGSPSGPATLEAIFAGRRQRLERDKML